MSELDKLMEMLDEMIFNGTVPVFEKEEEDSDE